MYHCDTTKPDREDEPPDETKKKMKISHTWTNEDGIEMAWATPSRREIAECKKGNGDDVLEYCEPPQGWDFAEDEDTSDDGGNPGRYLVRA